MKYPRITISGARGIVGEDLTVASALRLAQAFGSLHERGSVIVGRDGRSSGPMLHDAITAGLMASGHNVIDIGLAPTPTVGMAVKAFGAVGGVQITASHNPLPYNGMKFYDGEGFFVPPETIARLKERLAQDDLPHIHTTAVGMPRIIDRSEDALRLHVQRCLQKVDVKAIRARRLKVVVDGCRSVGGRYVPVLLHELGCDVVELDCEPDGAFTRELEPLTENIRGLCELVKRERADFGVAADPDADRAAFVDETGRPLGEESGVVLGIERVLARGERSAVVVNCCTTQQTEAAAARYGVTVIRTAVGELNVVQGMQRANSVIGGEGNGGLIYPGIYFGRDTMAAVAVMADALAQPGVKLSELFDRLPPSVMVKDKIQLQRIPEEDWRGKVLGLVPGATVEDIDGLRFVLPDRWLSVRLSNTEPIFRLIAEAYTREDAEALVTHAKEQMQRLM